MRTKANTYAKRLRKVVTFHRWTFLDDGTEVPIPDQYEPALPPAQMTGCRSCLLHEVIPLATGEERIRRAAILTPFTTETCASTLHAAHEDVANNDASSGERRLAKYMTAVDIAREFNVSRATAYRLIRQIPHLYRGGIRRVHHKAVERFVKENTQWPGSRKGASGRRKEALTGTAEFDCQMVEESSVQRDAPTAPRPKLRVAVSNTRPYIKETQPRTKPRGRDGA